MDETTRFQRWQSRPCPETLLGLLEELGTSVYPLCYRVLRHHQDAEDAAQKVLLEFLAVLRTLPSMDRMRAWIYRASILTALSFKRAQRRRMRYERTPRPGQDPNFSEEEGDLLHRHVADLDEDLRQVVVEHYFERRTLAELSAKAHCSTGAVWKKLQKAQDELRRSLARAGLTGSAVAILALLESRDAVAAWTTGLPQAVIEKAREVASGARPASTGWLLRSAVGTAIAVAVLVGIVAVHHREETPVSATPASVSRPRSAAAAAPIPARKSEPSKPAVVPVEAEKETLFARLQRLRATLEVIVPQGSLGSYVREHEELHPLVLREPDTYIAFLRMPESRKYFSFFLDLLGYPGPVTGSTPLPDLPRTISKGLAELLMTGTQEQILLIFDRTHSLGHSFRNSSLTEDLAPACLQLVFGPDEDFRILALGFLTSHGHEDRLDLIQSVWQNCRRFQNRMSCINILARSKGSAAGELLDQWLQQILKQEDPQELARLPLIVQDRLSQADNDEERERCRRLLGACLRKETREGEFQSKLSIVRFLPVPKQAVLLRELSGHAPSAAINDHIAKTLELIDRGETQSGVLWEMLMYGRAASATPAAPAGPPVAVAPEPSVGDASLPQGDGTVPEAFEAVSKDGKLKGVIKKGKDGFSSEFQVWDLEKDNRLIQGFNAFQITAFAFSPDGKSYAMADREGTVVVRTVATSASHHFQSQGLVTALSFSADGQTVRSRSQSWSLRAER